MANSSNNRIFYSPRIEYCQEVYSEEEMYGSISILVLFVINAMRS
ncbi:MAG: hypothetical protein ACFE85_11380 [Candidatus Hodarchaeota archaeon]